MTVIDTNLVLERVSEGKAIHENTTIITVIEYPMILEYKYFYGKIFYPEAGDLNFAVELQNKLRKIGRMKGSADLIIAAICINKDEPLSTNDSDFDDIQSVSDLKLS